MSAVSQEIQTAAPPVELEIDGLRKIGDDILSLHSIDSGDDDPIDPLAEDALEHQLKRTRADALAKYLASLHEKRRQGNANPLEDHTEVLTDGINWAFSCHIEVRKKLGFKVSRCSSVSPLKDYTVERLPNALFKVRKAFQFYVDWVTLQFFLAARVEQATHAHIGALCSIVEERDVTVTRLKEILAREKDLLASVQETMNEKSTPVIVSSMFAIAIALLLCLLLK